MKDHEALRAEVVVLARNLISIYKWRIVDQSILVARVMEWIKAGAPTEGAYALERLCEHAAAEQLYNSCALGMRREEKLSANDKRRLESAYEDLANYLTAMATRLRRPIAPNVTLKELVQNTLIIIHKKLDKQTNLSYFLAWAVKILEFKRRETWRDWYAHNKHIQPPDGDGEEGGNSEVDNMEASGSAPDEQDRDHDNSLQGMGSEADDQLFTILSECLEDDQERLLALGLMVGMKRRNMQSIFAMLKDDFNSVRRKLITRLRTCCRYLVLFNLVESPPKICKAIRCRLRADGRSC